MSNKDEMLTKYKSNYEELARCMRAVASMKPSPAKAEMLHRIEVLLTDGMRILGLPEEEIAKIIDFTEEEIAAVLGDVPGTGN